MNKILRKILPSILMTAILVIVGGFSDGMVANAKMGSINDNLVPSETMHYMSDGPILHQSVPLDNSLKPCCENQQGGASAIQSSAFDQNVKLSAIDFSESIFDTNYVFEHKILELSSASPPKPDILSSVFLKE